MTAIPNEGRRPLEAGRCSDYTSTIVNTFKQRGRIEPMRCSLRVLGTIGTTVLAVGCGSDISGPPEEVTFAPELNVDLTQMTMTSTGLYYQDLTVGDGDEAVSSATLTVHYTGWLPDGTEFDSSRRAGREPLQFVLGARQVIPGWDEGLLGMRVGGQRKLVIPPHLGYGQAGSGSIPGNTSLVFDVELLQVSMSSEQWVVSREW